MLSSGIWNIPNELAVYIYCVYSVTALNIATQSSQGNCYWWTLDTTQSHKFRVNPVRIATFTTVICLECCDLHKSSISWVFRHANWCWICDKPYHKTINKVRNLLLNSMLHCTVCELKDCYAIFNSQVKTVTVLSRCTYENNVENLLLWNICMLLKYHNKRNKHIMSMFSLNIKSRYAITFQLSLMLASIMIHIWLNLK